MDSDEEREKSSGPNESSDSEEKIFLDSDDDDDDDSDGSSAPLVAHYEQDNDDDNNELTVDDLDNNDEADKMESADEKAISVVEVNRNIGECNTRLDSIMGRLLDERENLLATAEEALEVEKLKINDDMGIVFTAKITPDADDMRNIMERMDLARATARKRPSILEEPVFYDLADSESNKPESECYFSAQDFLEYGGLLTSDSKTPDLESGYYERSESDISREDLEHRHGKSNFTMQELTSEGLREELNRFRLMIDIMENERSNKNINQHDNEKMDFSCKEHEDCETVEVQNIETKINEDSLNEEGAQQRGYWSTVFGEASKIEIGVELTLDERVADIQKAHRALELLEDYHSRLSEPQDRALRIAIERVIRIFKSRLFQALLERDYMKAYRQQTLCIQYVVKMLQQLKEENWCLPIMYTTCLDLRILARKCEDLGQRSTPGEILEKAADGLMACFRVCAADNRSSDEDTKRLGMLNLVNQLFKVYFRINKLHLCKPLIRAIESSAFRDSFPLAEQITYKYFVGRKAMFDSDYKSADEFLSFAFRYCPRQFSHNKRLILIYLVPVKMLLGYMPKKEILERYDVLQFYELVVALKEGDVRKFDEVMHRHELWFIKCGIYLLVERLKFIVYRNLFKRVYLLRQTHQLNMNDFHAALKFVGEDDVCMDETHCIIANLIFEGKIKGYISYSHNKLVVSKQNPFPPISSVATTVT